MKLFKLLVQTGLLAAPLAFFNCMTDDNGDKIRIDTVTVKDTITKEVVKQVTDTQYVFDTTQASKNGKAFEVRFYPRFDTMALAMQQKVETEAGDSVQFDMLQFYVSEFSLVDTNGSERALPGLALIDFSDSTARKNGYAKLTLKALPGTFSGLKFSVGVPYDLNHRDVSLQKYPLGPDVGMFWVWNSGYIFHRIEGKVDSADSTRPFFYHIGTDNRKVNVQLYNLPNPYAPTAVASRMDVPANGTGSLSIDVDYAKVFTAGLTPGKALNPGLDTLERAAHGGPLADRVFLNMTTMFSQRK
jgi:hypothetical protein